MSYLNRMEFIRYELFYLVIIYLTWYDYLILCCFLTYIQIMFFFNTELSLYSAHNSLVTSNVLLLSQQCHDQFQLMAIVT